jgi:hypothetical protein
MFESIKNKLENTKKKFGMDDESIKQRHINNLAGIQRQREMTALELKVERQRATLTRERNQIEKLRNPATKQQSMFGKTEGFSMGSLGRESAFGGKGKKKSQFGWKF